MMNVDEEPLREEEVARFLWKGATWMTCLFQKDRNYLCTNTIRSSGSCESKIFPFSLGPEFSVAPGVDFNNRLEDFKSTDLNIPNHRNVHQK
jgi:hypothetical protein